MNKIGIDFGTSYTKIAYPDENNYPRLFHYPSEQQGKPYISSEITYVQEAEGEARYIGSLAFGAHIKTAYPIDSYQNFKMNLPSSSAITPLQSTISRDGRTPLSITQDYFKELLTTGQFSFTKKAGSIDRLIVSVPENWYHAEDNPGPDRLLKIFGMLGFPPEMLQLQSEPVCAAAYYAYRDQKRSKSQKRDTYNLLVCDMGGGTFDVALCQVKDTCIEVKFVGGSRDTAGLGLAGVAFDCACVDAACQAYYKGSPPTHEAHKQKHRRAFEEVKIGMVDQDILELVNEENAHNSYHDTPVYSFSCNNQYDVTIAMVWDAFLPIRNEISNVLRSVQAWCSKENIKIDQAVVVGGFGQFPLVKKAIFECLPGLDPNDTAKVLPENDRYHAVVKGAFYIINEMVEVNETYPHSLGIVVKRIVDGIFRPRDEIVIIQAGREPAGMTAPKFAINNAGEREILVVPENCQGDLPVYAKRNGSSTSRLVRLKGQQNLLKPGKYWVGFQINRSNRASLILESIDGAEKWTYPVGELTWE